MYFVTDFMKYLNLQNKNKQKEKKKCEKKMEEISNKDDTSVSYLF